MIIEYKYGVNYNEETIVYLDELGIEYRVIKVYDRIPIRIHFELITSKKDDSIIDSLKEREINYYNRYAEYTKKEIEEAKWLILSPNKQSIDICNEDAFMHKCTDIDVLGYPSNNHEVQIKDVIVRKEPNMKKRTAFWFESTGQMNIFTDYRVKNLATSNELKGLWFRDVYLKNKTKSESLFQLDSQQHIDDSYFNFIYGEKVIVCPKCGKKQYVIDGAYQLHLKSDKIDDNIDLYITDPMFGDGVGYPKFIISQRFYQLLKKYNLIGGLRLVPVLED